MPIIKASVQNVRLAPRKARLVADAVRGLKVPAAEARLIFISKKGAPIILKLLKSAVSNAEHRFHLQPENLKISSIFVNSGITFKRHQPRAFGRATTVRKRTSTIHLALEAVSMPKQQDKKLFKKINKEK